MIAGGHCEERSDEAIQRVSEAALDCFPPASAGIAMTERLYSATSATLSL